MQTDRRAGRDLLKNIDSDTGVREEILRMNLKKIERGCLIQNVLVVLGSQPDPNTGPLELQFALGCGVETKRSRIFRLVSPGLQFGKAASRKYAAKSLGQCAAFGSHH